MSPKWNKKKKLYEGEDIFGRTFYLTKCAVEHPYAELIKISSRTYKCAECGRKKRISGLTKDVEATS
jgi:hypothetical protein